MGKQIDLSNTTVQLQKYGMPIQFLNYVKNQMKIELGDSDRVGGWFGFEYMELSPSTINPLKKISLSRPYGESTAILTLYHEATHAFFLLRKNDPNIKTLIEYCTKYYRGAPLRREETADNPKRLFNEAAADYVGHRAASFWGILENIVINIETIEELAKNLENRHKRVEENTLRGINYFLKTTKNIPKEYNNKMRQKTFGYEYEWKGLRRIQTHTTKQMPDQLKKFCDKIILEEKIPDNFYHANILLKRYNTLLKLLTSFTQHQLVR